MPSGNLRFGMLSSEMKKKLRETQLRHFGIPNHIPSETPSIQAFIGKPQEAVGLKKWLCLIRISTTTISLIQCLNSYL